MLEETTKPVQFLSTPPGATVRVGDAAYKTPTTIQMSDFVSEVVYEHPEFGALDVDLGRRLQSEWVPLNIIFGGVILGPLIDELSGAWYTLPNVVEVELATGEVARTYPDYAPEM